MPNYAGSQLDVLADLHLGARVDRTAAKVAAATVNLFTVAGGRVLLTGFLGEIVVAIAATACTILVEALTTDVTAVVTPLCIAGSDIQSLAAGRMITLPAAVGSVMTLSTGSSAAIFTAAPWYVLKTGGLQLTGSGAPATGTVKWSVWYVPIDPGAYMAAA